MRLKKRTIAGGLVVAGAVLGTMISGLLPGFGAGSGIEVTTATPTDTDSSHAPKPEDPQQTDSTDVEAAPVPKVLEVRVDDRDYLIPDSSEAGFRRADLSEVITLAKATTGNDEGIRVRIIRSRSARVVAWSTLYDSLEESGLARDSIRMPKELID